MLTLQRVAWLRTLFLSAPGTNRGQLHAVTMDVGRGDARIRAVAYVDGNLHIAFGSGEEFVGGYRDLPARVGAAARTLLDEATALIGRLPELGPDDPPCAGSVRFALHTATAVYAQGAGVADLREGRSDLAPLWRSFSDLLEPMIVVLFARPVSPGQAQQETPALARARSLWSKGL